MMTHGRPERTGPALERLEALADRLGVELALAPEELDKHGRADGDGSLEDADLAVVLGGDGTTLRALTRFLGTGVAVIGVNFGRVGFLSAMEEAELESGLERAFAGDYAVIELATLACEIGDVERSAVNDVVAHSATVGRMVEISWAVDGEELGELACDGVVCCTPAGSTAYNLSAGGPVLVWGLEAMAVTFVAPHSLQARPLVVPRGREVTVRNLTPDVPLAVTLDGRVFEELRAGGELRLRLHERRARLATLPERTFFRRFRDTFAP
ncbi:MAG: NAD(+)/NADH kinase [Thermoleophilia bacterium]|nr:NAD(+)/NADH kinase [Thermoleophilia bacterium]